MSDLTIKNDMVRPSQQTTLSREIRADLASISFMKTNLTAILMRHHNNIPLGRAGRDAISSLCKVADALAVPGVAP